jgi:UDP-GlcNAc:undecaprenyl-phosphate GlcNAc-1-phosphate transferase
MITAAGLNIQFPAFPILNNTLFSQAFTVFSLVSLINATNFLDGLNGLLAGSVALTLVFIIFMFPLYSPPSVYGLLLIAAILGFLIFNFPRGKIFMGDIGSTFLGLSLGFIALLTQEDASTLSETAWIHKSFILSLTPMAFLWFDVGFTLVRRAFLKRRLTEPHRDHLFHLLHDKGYSHLFVSNLHFLTVILMGGLSLLCYGGMISFIELVLIYSLLQAGFCWWVFRGALGRAIN